MRLRNKEQTKKNILKAAINEFTKKGFLDASTEDIAKRADVAHGTIFFYFPKKSDLIIESIYKKMGKLAEVLNEKSRECEDIRELCEIFLEGIQRYQRFYSRLVKDLPLLSINIQRIVFASLAAFSVHFVDVIEKGQRKKKFKKFKPKIAMFYWFGMINYLNSYSKLLGTKKLSEKMKGEIIDFFVSAISK
jgi:AcrR family transcriptional regulator